MRIVFTGGGTGGHFYPIIAIAREVHALAREKRLLEAELYYIAPAPFDKKVLFENRIAFRQSPAGKMRRYFSLLNIFDIFKTAFGILKALIQLFSIYPDVVLSKGGYASFPTVIAARILRIPVVVHESDVVPGRANRWAAKFAHSIAVSYKEAVGQFPDKKEKVALVGNPIRREFFIPAKEGAHEFLDLDKFTPVVFVLGGSQGAARINSVILEALPALIERYQIIHQTGRANMEEIKKLAPVILGDNPKRNRYKPFDYLNLLAMRMAAGASSLVITRAGSGAIAELAAWGAPSILIPIPEKISHDQRKNAFAYARTGAAVVVEEENITPNILTAEINRLMDDPALRETMGEKAREFARPDAARKIAELLVHIALEHELA